MSALLRLRPLRLRLSSTATSASSLPSTPKINFTTTIPPGNWREMKMEGAILFGGRKEENEVSERKRKSPCGEVRAEYAEQGMHEKEGNLNLDGASGRR